MRISEFTILALAVCASLRLLQTLFIKHMFLNVLPNNLYHSTKRFIFMYHRKDVPKTIFKNKFYLITQWLL